MKWVIVTDTLGEPAFVLDAHHFLRDALFNQLEKDPTAYWHRPIIVRDPRTRLGEVYGLIKVIPERSGDDVIDHDLILVWSTERRIITGADLLGRLLRGITQVEPRPAAKVVTTGDRAPLFHGGPRALFLLRVISWRRCCPSLHFNTRE